MLTYDHTSDATHHSRYRRHVCLPRLLLLLLLCLMTKQSDVNGKQFNVWFATQACHYDLQHTKSEILFTSYTLPIYVFKSMFLLA